MFDQNFYEDEQNRNPENPTEVIEKDRNEVLIRGTIIGITGNTRMSRLRVLCDTGRYTDVPTVTFEGRNRPHFLPGERVTIRGHFHLVELKNGDNITRFTTIYGDEIFATETMEDPLTGSPFYPSDLNRFCIYGNIVKNDERERTSILHVKTTEKEEVDVRVFCFGGMQVRAKQMEEGRFVKIEGRIQTPDREHESQRNFETPVAIRLA